MTIRLGLQVPDLGKITDGFRHGARIVSAAALIMGVVFCGFILG